uniref:Protein-tyrosine-phosphatase n=1 Tax=Astatotilapia calliptera TaxID=8154 RepID=A0AAX7TK49_ASTCA
MKRIPALPPGSSDTRQPAMTATCRAAPRAVSTVLWRLSAAYKQMAVSQITPTLFLSGADAPLNAGLVLKKGITLIVNATLSHACPAYPGVECLRVPVSDLPSARLGDYFDWVAKRIHGNCGGGTLVHCAAGMSRSPALVMAYLMRYRGVTLRRAHHWVQESRPYIRLNAGFWEQLLQYEKRLYGRNTVRVAPEPPPRTPPGTPRLARSQQQTGLLTLVPRSPLMSRAQVTSSANRSRR